MGVNIAHFGAFNIESYGDSLFAEVFRREINNRIDIECITLFSIDGIDSAYNNNGKVYSYTEFDSINSERNFNAIVIGGGELLHYKSIEFKNKNDSEDYIYPEGEIWKYPISMGKKYNIPVIFNSVGVPYDFDNYQKNDFYEYMSSVSYLSVRDEFSFGRLSDVVKAESIKLVPDTVFKIYEYYNQEKLNLIFNKITKENNLKINRKEYIVLQYGTLYKIDELCMEIKRIKHIHGIGILVMPINYCHEDIQSVEKIKEFFWDSNDIYFIESKLNPIEIMSIISNSKLFIGTSLHGSLTAITYGVQCVAIDMYGSFVSKIDGLFDLLDMGSKIIPDPNGLYSKFKSILHNGSDVDKSDVFKFLGIIDRHFDEIANIIISNLNKKIEFKERYKHIEKEKFIKSFIEIIDGEIREQKYAISELINDSYLFKFNFETKDYDIRFSFNLVINKPMKITIAGVYPNTELIPVNSVDSSDYSNMFINERAVFSGTILAGCSELTVDCIVEEYDKNEVMLGLKNLNSNKDAHIELLLETERSIKELLKNKEIKILELNKKIQDQENAKFDLNQILHNKDAHIDVLLERERELNHIYDSRSWRYMRKLWRLRDVLMPKNSKRRLFLRISYKFVRNPVKFINKININNIKKFFYYLKKEGPNGISSRINDSIIGNELKPDKLDITGINHRTTKKFEDYIKIAVPIYDNPKVSIIIPVYNEFEYTYNCIKSIVKQTELTEYEIIIGDDCSSDLTNRISEIVDGIKVINNKDNLGFLKNCNNAANYAEGKYILFLNNDTQVQTNWLEPLVDLIESDDQIGMVGSKLIYPDGRLQEAGGIFWRDGSAWNYGNKSVSEYPEYNYVKEVDYISGAAIMLSKDLWEEIEGFDEQFVPAYCEDSDLAFTVRSKGYKVMYQPLSVVVHFEGVSNGTDVSSGMKSYQIVNQKKLYEKWKHVLEKEHFENGQHVFQARDRTRNKKTILVIDHYVPHYDKDAGSRTVYQYLKLFLNMGYNVKFIGDNFFKHEPYTSELQQMGIEVLYGNYYENNWKNWIKINAEYIDFVFLNRPHISVKYIDFIKSNTDAKIIYYGHDLHFLREMREYELTGNRDLIKTSEYWKNKELSLMRKSDVVYYPSIVEENEIKTIDNNINVKSIPAYIFDDVDEILYNIADRNDIMFIGGFNHKPNVDAVIWLAEEIYPIVSSYGLGIKFYIIGSNPPDEIKKYANENFIIKGFIDDDELEKYYNTSRLSIVPLRYGAGIKGKVVEAMKHGIPVITTRVGSEGIIESEEFLCIAESAVDFADKIIYLYNNEVKLSDMSIKSKDYVSKIFNVKNVLNIIGEDFDF